MRPVFQWNSEVFFIRHCLRLRNSVCWETTSHPMWYAPVFKGNQSTGNVTSLNKTEQSLYKFFNAMCNNRLTFLLDDFKYSIPKLKILLTLKSTHIDKSIVGKKSHDRHDKCKHNCLIRIANKDTNPLAWRMYAHSSVQTFTSHKGSSCERTHVTWSAHLIVPHVVVSMNTKVCHAKMNLQNAIQWGCSYQKWMLFIIVSI